MIEKADSYLIGELSDIVSDACVVRRRKWVYDFIRSIDNHPSREIFPLVERRGRGTSRRYSEKAVYMAAFCVRMKLVGIENHWIRQHIREVGRELDFDKGSLCQMVVPIFWGAIFEPDDIDDPEYFLCDATILLNRKIEANCGFWINATNLTKRVSNEIYHKRAMSGWRATLRGWVK